MRTIEELKRNALETDLRKQRLEESIPHIGALATAERAAATAVQEAVTADSEAKAKEQAFKDAEPGAAKDALKTDAETLRSTANTKRIAATTAQQEMEDARLKAEVYQKHALKIGESENDATANRLVEAFFSLSTWIWVALFAAVGVLLYVVSANDAGFLATLGKPESARALIMVLILGTTLLLAVMLCYQAYANGTTNDQFRMAREIYTTLIGVVGTVVGFYFATGTPNQGYPPPLSAVTMVFKENALNVAITGGTAPFKWELRDAADPKIIPKKSEGKDEDKNIFNIIVTDELRGKMVILQVTDGAGTIKASDKVQISPLPVTQTGTLPPPAELSDVKMTRSQDKLKLNVVITGGQKPFNWELLEHTSNGTQETRDHGTADQTAFDIILKDAWKNKMLSLKVTDGVNKSRPSAPLKLEP